MKTFSPGRLGRRVPSLFDLQANVLWGGFPRSGNYGGGVEGAFDVMRERYFMHRILLTITTNTIDRMCRQFERIEGFAGNDAVIAETMRVTISRGLI